MLTHPNNVIQGPWSESIRPVLANFDDFRSVILNYCADWKAAQDSLSAACELLDQTSDIRPSQCDHAVDAIHRVAKAAQQLSDVLNESVRLPNTVITPRYSPIASLCYLEKQTNTLALMIGTFRNVCLSHSRSTSKQRQVIIYKLKSLRHANENLSQEIADLLDQSRFQN